MSNIEDFWGDDLPEGVVAECVEIETQATQFQSQRPPPQHAGSSTNSSLHHIELPNSSFLEKIPMILNTQPFRLIETNVSPEMKSLHEEHSQNHEKLHLEKMTVGQRKLKTPIKSLPNPMCYQATTDWLRTQLEKSRTACSDLEKTKQELEGEVNLLRDRCKTFQTQFHKTKEKADEERNKKELILHNRIKELEKKLENREMQLLMKTKECEANSERYKELKNLSVVGPEFVSTQSVFQERLKPILKVPQQRNKDGSSDEDNEDWLFHLPRSKRLKKSQGHPKNIVLSESEVKQCSSKSSGASHSVTDQQAEEVEPSAESVRTESLSEVRTVAQLIVNLGALFSKQISNAIFTTADPELKIIITPEVDYNPKNVLKMDYSDLQYLKDLEKGYNLWGVDLKTMYSNEMEHAKDERKSKEGDKETLETIKTILGSQMCSRSPDARDPLGAGLRSDCVSPSTDSPKHPLPYHPFVSFPSFPSDPLLLKSLEPIHIHIRALTKLSNWSSSFDLICPIVLHLASMVNELYERLCDPSVPHQLKDDFHNNEVSVGKLFMDNSYREKDPLSHERWNDRERYVELRRGLALLAVLCSLHRDIANMVLNPSLLSEKSKQGSCKEKEETFGFESSDVSFSNVRRKEELEYKIISLKKSRQLQADCTTSQKISDISTSNLSSKKFLTDEELLQSLINLNIQKEEEQSLADLDSDSSSNTINPDEMMSFDILHSRGDSLPNNESRNIEENGRDSFKAWYNLYTESKKVKPSVNVEDNGQKLIRIIDPNLADNERRQLGLYLQRSTHFNDFFKAVAEEGNIWVPEKSDGIDKDVRNLYDYENKIKCLDKTITIDELTRMKPLQSSSVQPGIIDKDLEADEKESDCSLDNDKRSLPKNLEDHGISKDIRIETDDEQDKSTSFFERLKTMERIKIPPKNAYERVPNIKEGTVEELRTVLGSDCTKVHKIGSKKHSLAPLKKPLKKDIKANNNGSFSDIKEQVEKEVELLYEQDQHKSGGFKKFKKNEVAVRPGTSKISTITGTNDFRLTTTVLPMNHERFEEHFYALYQKVNTAATRINMNFPPYSQLAIVNKVKELKDSKNQISKHHSSKNKSVKNSKKQKYGERMESDKSVSEDNSKAILNMLTEEAEKYNLNEHIQSFEEKKGKLSILDGIYEIVYSINYCRLTMIFYPLLSSCVLLIESVFIHSLNNKYFNKESLVLLLKIINEVICCQPPPTVIGRVLNMMMYASAFPEIIDCLCKKRSPLVSLVTEQEFCFFKGVCLMQPLCFLMGILSKAESSSYWEMSLSLIRWLKLLYKTYPDLLAHWYPSDDSAYKLTQVCNCVPAQHNCVFTTLTKATGYYANHVSKLEDKALKKTIEDILRDGVILCESLVQMDADFISHLQDFELYTEFLYTIKRIHSNDYFYPTFHLSEYELNVVEYLIKAEQMARKSDTNLRVEEDDISSSGESFFDPNQIFLSRVERHNKQCSFQSETYLF